jgi:hypothetical protein
MRKFLNTIILLFFFITAYSQDFQGGVLLGISGSQIDGDTYAGYNKAGLVAGAFVRRDFTKHWAWQMELKYIGKGASAKNSKNTQFDPYKVNLHYVELPVLFQYKFNDKILAEFGPAYAYLFHSSNDLDGYGNIAPDPPFNKSDLSGIAGFTYNFGLKWAINLKYSYSLIPIRGTENLNEYLYNGSQYNHQICIVLNYKIR